ncbi:peptide-methionine (R)-S-oxide reductase MsrB [Mycoplasma sp. 'Moose RK']|uniref:peptide-methionine (R)-S-oxide reductase MsrB n=1 Tax=Mycoplasma sp. 'Moose RK' TaxID=2780095 RepID=UPI0018C240B6|nr:peptide-methionine (R)-S-oxide reductase MsrB [Mycoplasma sp. 'Moose RK']MBG0730601.1 peptide-methionine (R)-S-oxide reductase MsrB [Mycoplasma sp. 'Moose RK']
MEKDPKFAHLTDLQYRVTQKNETEPPFDNAYNKNFEDGVYVDVVDHTPLFLSTAKYDSGSGWPAFWKPIDDNLIDEVLDFSHEITRIEVRSKKSNSHLGHVFVDGPVKHGGKRYCINSAALKFIPKSELEKNNLGYLLPFFETK